MKKLLKIPVTKYNPKDYDSSNYYSKDDWTSVSDINKTYNGTKLNTIEYLKVEESYVKAIRLIHNYYKCNGFKITHLIDYESILPTMYQLNFLQNIEKVDRLIKLRLRERLAGLEFDLLGLKQIKIIFGFDYYMYFITDSIDVALKQKLEEINIFINEDRVVEYHEYT